MLRIKELRTKQKVSQQQLAEHLQITQQAVYKYEHVFSEPDIDTLIECARYFDTTVDYLIGATDYPHLIVNHEASITSKENEILKYFRALNDRSQELILELIQEQNQTKKPE